MFELRAIILAAGKGTRMKSELSKVLHHVGGKPMVEQVIEVTKAAGVVKNIVVVGFGAESVREALAGKAEFAVQQEKLGTAHAVLQTKAGFTDFTGDVLVVCGDTPLLTAQTLQKLHGAHVTEGASATVLTAFMPDAGYGRVVRNLSGQVVRIVEKKDATPEELVIKEYNSGIYCFKARALFAALEKVNCNNAQAEYYLPDVISILAKQNAKVIGVPVDDYQETLGINSRVQLAQAEKILRLRKLNELMENGVTIMDPDSTFIDSAVKIRPDTTILPFTWLEGNTCIGSNSVIGPNCRVTDSIIGKNVTLHFSYVHDCKIGDGAVVGPYVHLRPATELANGVKVGNFVEIKNSIIGEKSKIPHLSYIGDTDMGSGVNIGSGTITVNYDGKSKHRTVIENDAFVGCNTNLVAPVKVGSGSYIAAGSTITKDVPPGSLGVARARQSNLEGWVHGKKK